MSLLDPDWKYTKAQDTNVSKTLRDFGFKPTTEAERKARQKKQKATVTPISSVLNHIQKRK